MIIKITGVRTQETKWQVDLSEAFPLLSKSLLLLRLETVLSTYARYISLISVIFC